MLRHSSLIKSNTRRQMRQRRIFITGKIRDESARSQQRDCCCCCCPIPSDRMADLVVFRAIHAPPMLSRAARRMSSDAPLSSLSVRIESCQYVLHTVIRSNVQTRELRRTFDGNADLCARRTDETRIAARDNQWRWPVKRRDRHSSPSISVR